MASTEPLQYRLEVQFVFAFHESLLLGQRVEKNIPDQIRAAPPFSHGAKFEPFQAYNSWGVYSNDGTSYRPYKNEPVLIAREILEDAGVEMNTSVLGHDQNQRLSGIGPWHMAAEPGLPGVGSAGLIQHLPSRVTPANVDQWDSYGLSAYSKAFTAFVRGQNLDELNDLIFGVRGVEADGHVSQMHGAFVTNLTGLHVHIDPPMNLDVLRELAFILVVYEDEISRLHPPHRQVGHPSTRGILQSNRLGLLRRAKYNLGNESVDLNRPDRLSEAVDVETIRQVINWTDGDTLLNVVGNQGDELVSWHLSAHRDDGSITLVFRQHQGSLDPLEIAAWADFTTNLVRVAERFHAQGGCSIRDWEDNISVFALMDGMVDRHIEYFRRRIAFYMNNGENRPPYSTDLEMPPHSQNTSKTREDGSEVPDRDVGIPGDTIAGEEPEFPDNKESDGAEGTAKKRPVTEQPLDDPQVPKKQKGSSRVMPGSAVPQRTYRPGDIIPSINASKQNRILYEAGTIADEDMIYLNQRLYVCNYDPSDWEILQTPENGPDKDRSLPNKCGIWALLNSLHYQYEDDPAVAALDYQQVYQAVQYESSDERNNALGDHEMWSHTYSPMELARGLRTLGRFKLVTCSEAGQQSAVRIAPVHELVRDGRNVYLQEITSSGRRSAHLHWAAMRRLTSAPPHRIGLTPTSIHPSALANYGFTPINSRPPTPDNTSGFTPFNTRPSSSSNASGFTPVNRPRANRRKQASVVTTAPPIIPENKQAAVSGKTPPVTPANPREDEGWVGDSQPRRSERIRARKAALPETEAPLDDQPDESSSDEFWIQPDESSSDESSSDESSSGESSSDESRTDEFRI